MARTPQFPLTYNEVKREIELYKQDLANGTIDRADFWDFCGRLGVSDDELINVMENPNEKNMELAQLLKKYVTWQKGQYLETLDLDLNGKTQIFPFKNGVSYLGFHTYIADNGRPIRKLKNQNKRNAQRKFIRMARLVVEGKLPMKKFQASYQAWKNHASHGNCKGLISCMDKKINEILKTRSGD